MVDFYFMDKVIILLKVKYCIFEFFVINECYKYMEYLFIFILYIKIIFRRDVCVVII